MSGEPVVIPEQVESDLEVFVRQGCPHCEKAKTYLTQLKQRYPQLKVTVRDIGEDPHAFLRLKTLVVKFDMTHLGVPAFYVRGEYAPCVKKAAAFSLAPLRTDPSERLSMLF